MLGPGRGGVGRGRGDAPLYWGEESAGRSEEFEARRLEPGRALDARQSALLGVGRAAPEASPEEEAAGLVDLEASGGGAAWRRRIAPRHRAAVKGFFAARAGAAESAGGTPKESPTEDGR